jgi:hypothetical protein
MSAATIIVAIAIAKILLAILAARLGRAFDSSADEEADFSPAFRRKQLEDTPTGNLPSEEYSSAAGSRQALGDFRDPDDHYDQRLNDYQDPPSGLGDGFGC